MRHRCRIPLFALVLTFVFTVSPLLGATQPNVVVILADDQGWGDLSVHGNKDLSTPNIDSLARDGALFERFFVCPVCSPTRAEFLTGRYHVRGNVTGTSLGDERLDLDEKTIAETFRAAGYATGAFGKWHNGMQAPYHPNHRGFDEYYGFCSGHWGHYFDPLLEHNGRLVTGTGYITDDLTSHAMQFIEENRNRPFFCYVPYNIPHSPMQVPDEYWHRFKDKELTMHNRDPEREEPLHQRAALAMCENIDWNVGRILDKLERLQLAENTIVLYFSDNGPNGWRWNGGMKGRKGSTDEGGVRSPLLIRWSGQIPAGKRVTQIAGAIDLLPTLADLAGVSLLQSKPLDGVSLKPLLLGDGTNWPERMIFSHWNRRDSVRTQQYRLDTDGQLFDMTSDPGQHHDVSKDHPDVAARLRGALADWRKLVARELDAPERPFTVGYSRETHLPARDGRPHGNVERSGRAPNCSYFTNWTSPDDSITWDIHVGAPGRYKAVVYYTCPAADLGSTVELACQKSRVQQKVAEAHDPPAYGGEADRTNERGSESYVKDFKPMTLGVLNLEQGPGQVLLRALDVPGKQVMEVRYLILTRMED